MKFRFTFSSEDGDQTKDFDNLPDAETYMNDYIKGVERWSQTTFFPYDSHTSYRLFKDRQGRVIKIDKIEHTTMNTIISDVQTVSQLEYQSFFELLKDAAIVFVDDNGNQYEYDGVSISEGKIKLSIKPTQKQ
jgi:hypothetical protein